VSLDFPACPEAKLQSLLNALEIRVDAWAISAQNGEGKSPIDGAPTRDLVASEIVANINDPFTLLKQQEDVDQVRLQLVWEAYLPLGRPRLRSLDQSVVFVPIATITGQDENADGGDYLEPFQELEPNVLEALHGPLNTGEGPYLPMSRLEKVVPAPPKKDDRIRIRHHASDAIRAHTAIMPRLRYNRVNSSLPDPTTVASLDIEIIPSVDVRAVIESIDVSMANGRAICLMPDLLPMPCKSKDCTTFLYSLQSAQHSGTATPSDTNATTPNPNSSLNVDVLAISLLVRLSISPTTTAEISMSWTTNVDFSLALNPAFGTPAQPMQRTNRPTSLNFRPYPDPSKARTDSVRTASTNLQHQMIPQSAPRQSLTSILSISFVAPDEPAVVGVPFLWRVLIVNNSAKPVKLAIVPLPRIQRPTNATQHFQKRHAPKASNASLPLLSTVYKKHTRNAPSIAKAVVEEQIVYALHHQTSASAIPADTDLLSLTAELRVGPLGVGACHEAEIIFVAYKTGVFAIDAIRIVDLAGEGEGGVGKINDIRDLPEVVVVEAQGGDDGDE